MQADEAAKSSTADARLDRLTAHDPDLCATPAALYATFSRVGGLMFSSGVVGREHGRIIAGKLNTEACRARGERAAAAAVLAILRAAQRELGSLDRVAKVVALTGYLHADEGFGPMREVMDAASHVVREIFLDAALPARTCVGVACLPGGGVVEIALVLELAGQPTQ